MVILGTYKSWDDPAGYILYWKAIFFEWLWFRNRKDYLLFQYGFISTTIFRETILLMFALTSKEPKHPGGK